MEGSCNLQMILVSVVKNKGSAFFDLEEVFEL